MEDPFTRNKRELEEALQDTPHSLLWFSLGDCVIKRQGDGGLALVMFVGEDGGATLVLIRGDVSSANYPWKSPRMTALPPCNSTLVPPYFEDWSAASRLSSVLLTLSANLAEAKTLHRLFPLSDTTPMHKMNKMPDPLPKGYSPVFCGPLVSKDQDFYGYVSLWYAFETSQAIILVSDGSEWIGMPTKAFPKDFPYDQVKTKDGDYAPFSSE